MLIQKTPVHLEHSLLENGYEAASASSRFMIKFKA
jgi:hypothetical protein